MNATPIFDDMLWITRGELRDTLNAIVLRGLLGQDVSGGIIRTWPTQETSIEA